MSIQIPPAVGTSGQIVEAVVVVAGSTEHRHVMAIGSAVSTAYGPLTSSGGLLVAVSNPSTAVTFTNAATTAVNVVNTVTILSASSGLVQISGSVTATAATNPWSSAPGFNVPLVSASSGLVQISGTPFFNLVGTSSGVAVVTTSGGLGVTILAGAVGSTVVSLSSVPTVTATAATNPWSSAPGFNLPMVSASSGFMQISGTAVIVSASSGLIQLSSAPLVIVATSGGAFTVATTATLLINVVGTSSGVAVVTTSGGLSVSISNALAPVTSSYGVLVQVSIGSTMGATPRYVNPVTSVSKISSSPGVLYTLIGYTSSTGAPEAAQVGLIRLYDATTSNVSVGASLVGAFPLGLYSSAGTTIPVVSAGSYAFPVTGMAFTAGISFDCAPLTTSTGVLLANATITALFR